jgi:hypothetical protein
LCYFFAVLIMNPKADEDYIQLVPAKTGSLVDQDGRQNILGVVAKLELTPVTTNKVLL